LYIRGTFAPVNDTTKANGGMTDAERMELAAQIPGMGND